MPVHLGLKVRAYFGGEPPVPVTAKASAKQQYAVHGSDSEQEAVTGLPCFTMTLRSIRNTGLRIPRSGVRISSGAPAISTSILVACSKCDWRAAFSRDELIACHGADYAMPNLLKHLAAPSCSRLGSNWDRCGVNVEPIEGRAVALLMHRDHPRQLAHSLM